MNPVLAEILASQKVVADDGEVYPCHSGVLPLTGLFLQRLIRENDYRSVLEVGFAYGVSSLYVGEMLLGKEGARHLLVDQAQSVYWRNIGIANLRRAGMPFELIEKPSELALPELLARGEKFDLAFIDGSHVFEHALLDFFYASRMVRVGGAIVFDDADFPSLSKLLSYISQFPAFRLELPELDALARAKLQCRLAWRRLFSGDSVIFPRAVALRKVSEDQRPWDWYQPF